LDDRLKVVWPARSLLGTNQRVDSKDAEGPSTKIDLYALATHRRKVAHAGDKPQTVESAFVGRNAELLELFVPGDASATASNILAHQSLFQASIVVGLISELLFVAVILSLYRLLKGVNAELAGLMVILILIDVPLALLGTANEVATLKLLRSADFLAAFDKPQRDALTLLLIDFDGKGVLVSEVFYRSGFIPRFIGVWLSINGVTYLVLSAVALLLPEHAKTATSIATPALLGEVALMLWLLIAGVRVRPASVVAGGSGEV
jgi:hypothetical protein